MTDRDVIYLVTVFWLTPEAEKDEPAGESVEHSRTWGWFPTLAIADEAIRENDAGMFEDGYYNAAVIEEMAWGSIAMAEREHWYRVDYDRATGAYAVAPRDKPAALAGVIGFGMG